MGLSRAAQHFCAGVLHHMPAICAITAPSPVSYLRLTPNRWAPTLIDLRAAGPRRRAARLPGVRRRRAERNGAAVQRRVPRCRCRGEPVPGARRGGLRRGRRAAPRAGAARRRPAATSALPHSLGQALDALAASEAVAGWFGPVFLDAYLRHKRVEAGTGRPGSTGRALRPLRRGVLTAGFDATGRIASSWRRSASWG